MLTSFRTIHQFLLSLWISAHHYFIFQMYTFILIWVGGGHTLWSFRGAFIFMLFLLVIWLYVKRQQDFECEISLHSLAWYWCSTEVLQSACHWTSNEIAFAVMKCSSCCGICLYTTPIEIPSWTSGQPMRYSLTCTKAHILNPYKHWLWIVCAVITCVLEIEVHHRALCYTFSVWIFLVILTLST
jgi:hypothetical protein